MLPGTTASLPVQEKCGTHLWRVQVFDVLPPLFKDAFPRRTPPEGPEGTVSFI